MGIVEIIKKNEKVFKDLEEITYLFCKKQGSNKLIVTFPGSTTAGKFVYNYVNTLIDVNTNRLFLMDNFGYRGCYLLGYHRNFTVEKSVVSLINTIMEDCGIKKENVIIQGSSKGGWIALYFAIKYKFGYAIVGGPQTKLGDFLIQNNQKSLLKIVDHIAGGHEEEDRKYLNNLLYDLIPGITKNSPKIYLHSGTVDLHYVEPFIKELENNNINYKLDVKEYDHHKYISKFYPEYLLETLNSIDNKLFDASIYKCDEKVDLNACVLSEDIKFFVDFVLENNSTVSFRGWALMENKNCEDFERYLIIKNEDNIQRYKINNESRSDVVKAFDNNILYKYSGISCRIKRKSLNKNLTVGILFKSKKENGLEYYNKKTNKKYLLKENSIETKNTWKLLGIIKHCLNKFISNNGK